MAGCTLEAPSLSSAELQVIRPGGCETYGCGSNSPEAGGKLFWELNELGLVNAQGIRIVSFEKWGTQYRPDVINGTLVGRDLQTGAIALSDPTFATFLLEDTQQGFEFQIEVTRVERLPMWTGSHFTTDYALFYSGPDGEKRDLCKAAEANADSGFHAVLFDDDRIDPDLLAVTAQEADWFTIGCAGSALAKQHLTANTKAGAATIGRPKPTLVQRTAWLKMLTADYCGDGHAFTVEKTKLHYADAKGVMSSVTPTDKLEALWTADGATCLNVPRVEYSPTALSLHVFGSSIAEDLAAFGCTPPPPCAHPLRWGTAYAASANY